MTTTEILQGIKNWVSNFFARKDGSYEQMIVGGAMNLAGQTVEVNSEMYHPTGVNHATGVAEVRSIKGNTVAWNSLVQDGNFSQGITEWQSNRGTISAANNIITFVGNSTTNTSKGFTSRYTFPFTSGHKYYSSLEIKGDFDSVLLSSNFSSSTDSIIFAIDSSYSNPNSFVKVSGIKNFTGESYNFRTSLRWIDNKNEGGSIQCKNITIIDLTLIYGAGNEPTTPEQFEADYFKWFGKPLTYEEYDEGSLRSVNMAAYKTIGFNQWDEEWEVGAFADGSLNSKNFIHVTPLTGYYFASTYPNVIFLYDASKNQIGVTAAPNVPFTTPSNCAFIKFRLSTSYGQTYNHDICINISNAERNGEYEPYEVHNYPMPVTTMKGKLNGEGASVVVFPDGMRSAGTIHDEIYISGGKTYGIKRVGSVDLGTLTWGSSGNSLYSAALPSNATRAVYSKGVCSKYPSATTVPIDDKTFVINTTYYTSQLPRIFLKDTAYSDAATFKTAMNGVMLYYELETPEIYEIDDFELPQNILVDSDGTEEVINAQGKENDSVAPYVDMIYSINAVGALNNLPQGYISEKSMDNFLARLSSAMGGTWTKTWNSTLKEWEFTFTPSANTNSLTQNNEEA